MSECIYVVHCYEKGATVDDYQKGALLDTESYFAMDITVRDASLSKALEEMANMLGMDFKPEDADICDGRVTLSRTENAEGYEPTERELESWRAGHTRMWIADYSCWIEKSRRMGDDEIMETLAKEKEEAAS